MSDADEVETGSNIDQLAEEIESSAKQKVSAIIIDLAKSNKVELFHTPESDAYVTVSIGGKIETWPVGSSEFTSYLTEKFLNAEQAAPGAQALRDAINTLRAEAHFRGPCIPVYVRTAQVDDVVYVDVGDVTRTIIKVTAAGWCPVPNAPVRFRRPKGMQALPIPERGGAIDELRQFLNVPKLEQWRLLLVWLIAVFFTKGPFTFLVLQGRQGSAKSTTARVLRRLCDPNMAALRAQPRSEEDLIVSARNCKVMAFDNISHIPDWLSDALCRLATGGGFATRQFFTNLDEVIVEACLPVMLTGIDDSVHRSDLLDRCLLMELPPIGPGQRRTEAEFWADFDSAAGRLLGAILDTLSGVLRHLPEAQERLTDRPRMADYAERGIAVELALGWGEGQFMDAYETNLVAADDIAIEASHVGTYVCELALQGWEGTRTELVKKLDQMFDLQGGPPRAWNEPALPSTKSRPRPKGWPTTPKALKSQLMRLIPNLATKGVQVTFWQTSGTGSKKMVTIKMIAPSPAHPVSAAAPGPLMAPIPFFPPQPPATLVGAPPTRSALPLQAPAPIIWPPPPRPAPSSDDAAQTPAPVIPKPTAS